MKNFYISDLDGTLLQDNATLSNFAKENILRLIDNDIKFTVASARGVEAIRNILDGIDLKVPVIEVNGAYISDLKTGKVRCVTEIPYIVKYELNYIFDLNSMNPIVSTYDGRRKKLCYIGAKNKGLEWFVNDRTRANDDRLCKIDNTLEVIDDRAVCYTMIDRKEKLQGLYNLLKQTYKDSLAVHLMENSYSPGWYWLSLYHKEATKASAINSLITKGNYGDHHVYTFGNEANDISMIKCGDTGIAVANATEELKGYADKIITSNSDDGVIKFILENEYGVEIEDSITESVT